MTLPYRSLSAVLDLIAPTQRSACHALMDRHAQRFRVAWGSRQSHQAWPGGYLGHLLEVLNLAVAQMALLARIGRPLDFTTSDVLVVLLVHDLEKAWLYGPSDPELGSPLPRSKAERAAFRLARLDEVGLTLTPAQAYALRYVEGEGADYRPGERTHSGLSVVCHLCDLLSARLYHDYPRAEHDPWASEEAQAVGWSPAGGRVPPALP